MLQTPARPTLQRKRSATGPGDDPTSSSTKRPAIGRKPSAGHAIMQVASSMSDIATQFGSTGGEPTPQRRKKAITQLVDDDELSDNKKIQAFKLIRRDASVADTLNAISKKSLRTYYIQSELGDLDM